MTIGEEITSASWVSQGGNVTSAGWQVTLSDPMWQVSSHSGVATLRTAIHLLLTYLLTFPAVKRVDSALGKWLIRRHAALRQSAERSTSSFHHEAAIDPIKPARGRRTQLNQASFTAHELNWSVRELQCEQSNDRLHSFEYACAIGRGDVNKRS